MGVEKWASCRFARPLLIAMLSKVSPAVVKGIVPPVSNCESLLRYGKGAEGGKEKAFQSVEWFKEKSCEVRVSVKAAEEESGNEVESETGLTASVVENRAKSQLID
jgi:hypothetical protein